jgi:hypothetical protein
LATGLIFESQEKKTPSEERSHAGRRIGIQSAREAKRLSRLAVALLHGCHLGRIKRGDCISMVIFVANAIAMESNHGTIP